MIFNLLIILSLYSFCFSNLKASNPIEEPNQYRSLSSHSTSHLLLTEKYQDLFYRKLHPYANPMFNPDSAFRFLLISKTNNQIITQETEELLWQEMSQAKDEVQNKFYFILNQVLKDSAKTAEFLSVGLTQKKGWAFREKAIQLEKASHSEKAKKFYILATHCNDEKGIEKIFDLFKDVMLNLQNEIIKFSLMNPSDALKEINSYCQTLRKIGCGIFPYMFYTEMKEIFDNQNNESFLPFLKTASDLGYVDAQNSLAMLYQKKGNDKQALDLFSISAEQGYYLAHHNKAVLLLSPEQPINKKDALKHFLQAAAQGVAIAQYNAGTLLSQGFEEQPVDKRQALTLFLQASEQGIPQAQCSAGMHFLLDFEKQAADINQGFDLLKEAISQNYIPAMSCLGLAYMKFTDEPEKALFWLEKAESLGDITAKKLLEIICPKDKLQDSLEQGIVFENRLNQIIKTMTYNASIQAEPTPYQ